MFGLRHAGFATLAREELRRGRGRCLGAARDMWAEGQCSEGREAVRCETYFHIVRLSFKKILERFPKKNYQKRSGCCVSHREEKERVEDGDLKMVLFTSPCHWYLLR